MTLESNSKEYLNQKEKTPELYFHDLEKVFGNLSKDDQNKIGIDIGDVTIYRRQINMKNDNLQKVIQTTYTIKRSAFKENYVKITKTILLNGSANYVILNNLDLDQEDKIAIKNLYDNIVYGKKLKEKKKNFVGENNIASKNNEILKEITGKLLDYQK